MVDVVIDCLIPDLYTRMSGKSYYLSQTWEWENGILMKKIVIIPAYNEAGCILNTIKHTKESCTEYDIIVINDASTDDTGDILRENGINHINLPINLGIGGAVQTGYKYAKENGYDIAVQVDADGQHDAAFLEAMFSKMIETDADMVIGSRFIENQGFQSSTTRRLGISFLSWLIKVLTGTRITDPTSGLRLIGKGGIELFSQEYPADYPEPETATALISRGYKVVEMPVIMNDRQAGESSINFTKSVYYMVKVTLAILVEVSRGIGLLWKR